jgi:hypothetical protein
MKAIFGILLISSALIGFLSYQQIHAGSSMMMSAPQNATELSDIGIDVKKCVLKDKLTVKWLKSNFRINDESIAAEILKSNNDWPGPCACPYNLNHAMQRCGGTSHYSRSNSSNLKCYPKDIIQYMIQ